VPAREVSEKRKKKVGKGGREAVNRAPLAGLLAYILELKGHRYSS